MKNNPPVLNTPISPDTLTAAVQRGIISSEQRQNLESLEVASEVPAPAMQDEPFRLVGGGNDVFVGLGLVVLLAGLWSAISTLFGATSMLSFATMALVVIGIAEFITRQKAMKFSSLVLGAAFVASVVGGIIFWLSGMVGEIELDNPFQAIALRDDVRLIGWLTSAGVMATAALYLWRYRVPLMAAVMALAGVALVCFVAADILFGQVLSVQIQITDPVEINRIVRRLLYLPLVCGLIIFTIGVWLDLKDKHRESLLSDCAFWMHVISAPLIVHPLFVLATGRDVGFSGNEPSQTATIITLFLIALFVYTALIIDRRSLLVPSLTYFGTIGIASLVQNASGTAGLPPFTVILVAVGALIVMFGTGWQKIRTLVVFNTLPHVVANKLPQVRQ